jgi:DMSO/TMAO reductase YedYZ molybdopterin-dependent catalytic subunit
MKILKPALSGLLAAGAGLTLAELLAAFIRPESSPLVTIGGSIIDATPTPVKEFAVREFGTNDKPILLAGIMLGIAVMAAVIGVIGARWRWTGMALMAVFGVAGAAAALTRPTSRPIDALPAIIAGFAAAALLWLLLRAAEPVPVAAPAAAEAEPAVTGEADVMGRATPGENRVPVRTGLGRRGFVTTAALVAGGAVVAGGAAAGLQRSKANSAAKLRGSVKLPTPADPAGARITTPGFYTENKNFYRVDTALTVPRIDVDGWQLKISGMVDKPMTLSFDDLIRQSLIERDITLSCVSNEVGGPYIGTARWIGVPLAALLNQAGIKAGADQIVARSTEGMSIGTPVGTVLDGRDAMIAIGMNGEALPLEHGFPARMLTPGLFGYVGACKWITELKLSTFDSFDAYWVQRGWAPEGPVKTASRIDVPAPFAGLQPGEVMVAGVAWAQHRGISRVEVQVDDNAWAEAELFPVPSTDTWVQWRYPWMATTGGHTLKVRATDATGDVQTEQRATPFPSGATGWHSVVVTVR